MLLQLLPGLLQIWRPGQAAPRRLPTAFSLVEFAVVPWTAWAAPSASNDIPQLHMHPVVEHGPQHTAASAELRRRWLPMDPGPMCPGVSHWLGRACIGGIPEPVPGRFFDLCVFYSDHLEREPFASVMVETSCPADHVCENYEDADHDLHIRCRPTAESAVRAAILHLRGRLNQLEEIARDIWSPEAFPMDETRDLDLQLNRLIHSLEYTYNRESGRIRVATAGMELEASRELGPRDPGPST